MHPAFICLFLSAIRESHYNYNRSDLKSVNISVITVTSSQTMSCYVGNCTSLEDCRREELISDCSSRDYDACITTIVQKGTVTSKRGRQTNSSRYFPVSAYGRVTVVKACGESDSCGPSEHYWWQDDCDRKSDEDSYTCTTCCTTPSCNSAPRLHSLPGILLCLLISLNKSSNSWRSLSFLTARIQLTGFIFIF